MTRRADIGPDERLWLSMLRGDADQATDWMTRHAIKGSLGVGPISYAVAVDHEEALRLDGDRNLILLNKLRRRRPGLRDRCRCDWLGEGTPEHEASPMCRSLRPEADRDQECFACDDCGEEFETRAALEGHEAESCWSGRLMDSPE